ncbi:MAG: BON domain-containing protein [Gemmataceae bacterium]|nr:BON domain-containing protein [Gemmataceae bacterium]
MRRALRRRWWALSVSAGLTLVSPTFAQPALPGPAAAPPRATAPAPAPARLPQLGGGQKERPQGAALIEDPVRLLEIAVELGWLADPVTFPHPLAAHINGRALEIRGVVPSAAARERAARVALQQCPFTLLDHVRVQPGPLPKASGVSINQLHGAATATIRKNFPRLASGIAVQARAFGQVVLGGTIPSYEEKLAVSQSLRQLPGCTSVINELKVASAAPAAPSWQAAAPKAPAPSAGSPSRPVASAPALVPPSVPPPPRPVAPASAAQPTSPQPASAATPTRSPWQAVPTPPRTDTQATPYGQVRAPSTTEARPAPRTTLPTPGAAKQPAYHASAPTTPESPLVPPPPRPILPASRVAAAAPKAGTQTSPYGSVATSGATETRPAPRPIPPVPATPGQSPFAPIPVKSASATGAAQPALALPKNSVQASARTPAGEYPSPYGGPPRPTTQAALPPVSARPLQSAAPAPTTSSATGKVVTANARPTDLRSGVRQAGTPPAPKSPGTPYAVPGEPYETTGVVVVGDARALLQRPAVVPTVPAPASLPAVTQASAVPSPAPAPTASPTEPEVRLRRAILKRLVGTAAREVDIAFHPNRRVVVQLRTPSKAEADRIAGLILGMPELRSYEPDLQIKAPE